MVFDSSKDALSLIMVSSATAGFFFFSPSKRLHGKREEDAFFFAMVNYGFAPGSSMKYQEFYFDRLYPWLVARRKEEDDFFFSFFFFLGVGRKLFC